MVTSKRAQAKWDFPRLLLPVPLFLWWAPVYPCFHRRPSNTSRYFGISLLWGYYSFFLSLGAHNFFCVCVCPPSLESLFSSVLWKSCDQIPLGFKVRFPGDCQCLCQIPRLGSLTWGSEPSQHWRTSLVLLFYNLWVTHLVRMRFHFIVIVPLLPSCWGFFFVFGHGYLFLIGSSVSCQWLLKS